LETNAGLKSYGHDVKIVSGANAPPSCGDLPGAVPERVTIMSVARVVAGP
jgi:hypothetical protein